MSHTELKKIGTERTQTKTELQNQITRIKAIDEELQEAPDAKIDELKEEKKKVRLQIDRLGERLKELKARQKDLQKKYGVLVSEHAMLRYFERVLGFDLDEIRRQITPEKTKEQIAILRSGLFPVGDFRVRAKDGTVVTVVGKRKKTERLP